jgi:hypothetical protein
MTENTSTNKLNIESQLLSHLFGSCTFIMYDLDRIKIKINEEISNV